MLLLEKYGDIKNEFQKIRQANIILAKHLANTQNLQTKVLHNQLGLCSFKG